MTIQLRTVRQDTTRCRRKRIKGLRDTIGAIALALTAISAPAAEYPTKPIALIVPFAPGGGGDITFRLIAEAIRPKLGQPVVVENKAGASGNIGFQVGSRAVPDGHTITGLAATLVVNPVLLKNAIDPIKSFTPVVAISTYYLALVVHPSVPANHISQLIALAKKKPEALSYAAYGGSVVLSKLMLEHAAGVKFLTVQYKGTGDQMRALFSGEVDASGIPLKAALPHIKEGRLKAVGYFGPRRAPQLPNVPAISEVVPGVTIGAWTGLGLPPNTPREIVERLNKAVVEALKEPYVRGRLVEAGDEPVGGTPEEFAKKIRRDLQTYSALAKNAGIEPQ